MRKGRQNTSSGPDLPGMEGCYRALFEAAADAILIYCDDRVVDCNPAALALFGARQREELIGRHPTELSTVDQPDGTDSVVAALKIRRRMLVEGTLSFEWRHRRLDRDESFIAQVTLAPMQWQGRPAVYASAYDVTERRQAEDDLRCLAAELQQKTGVLEEANRQLEAFSYSLSHDLRSYLARISLAGEALQEIDGGQLSSQGQFCQQAIVDTCQDMNGLIDTLLTLAGISRRELNWEDLDLHRLAAEVCAELAQIEGGRDLRFDIAPGLRAVGVRDLVRVALRNLFSNACKYTRGRAVAHIALTVERQGGEQVLVLSDNGSGFAMAEADQLFRPFQRLGNAQDHPGYGIGLATVERIIHRHGGRIWANASPGNGATFYFTLPAAIPAGGRL